MTDLLSIGDVAKSTGLRVSALRYYDELGLITVAERVGGSRRFSPDTVGRVSFIQRCQEAGFSLMEVQELLDDKDGEWRNLVEQKRYELIDRRARLDVIIELLGEIQECGCEAVASCPRAVATGSR